jgi:tRNA(Met) C34 N-acetyltransferase TmcA
MVSCQITLLVILLILNDVCIGLNAESLECHLTKYDLKRVEMYCNNMVDYHLIMDLIPTLARLYFLKSLGETHLSAVQAVIKLFWCRNISNSVEF